MSDVVFDAEPEDSWDRDDPLDELVDNLIRRALLLERDALIPRGDLRVTLDALTDLVARARLRRLSGRDLVRANELEEDIEFILLVRIGDG